MGLVGDGFTLVVADANAWRSIMVFKNDQDKIMNLDESKIMGLAGPTADCSNFSEYVQKNMTLYELNNNMRLSTWATANFIRGELATALRKGPFQTNILLGGYEPDAGSSLYYMDYMGAMSKVRTPAQQPSPSHPPPWLLLFVRVCFTPSHISALTRGALTHPATQQHDPLLPLRPPTRSAPQTNWTRSTSVRTATARTSASRSSTVNGRRDSRWRRGSKSCRSASTSWRPAS